MLQVVRKGAAVGLCAMGLVLFATEARSETIESYGTDYVAVSNSKAYEQCEITALFEGTIVQLSNGEEYELHRGERLRIDADGWKTADGHNARALYIKANEPIRVVHTTSFGETRVSTTLPSLSCESPAEQRYVFGQKTVKPSLVMIVPADKTEGFQLDGKVLRLENVYAVPGNEAWVYAVVDLGTRKAGSVLRLSATHSAYLSAVVGAEYEYLGQCDLEAMVSIDTLRSAPEYVLHEDPMLLASAAMASRQGTGNVEEVEEAEEVQETEESAKPEKKEKAKSDASHRCAIYLQGGYEGMPLKMYKYQTSMGLGYGAAAGVLYELQKKTFLMQTGAGFYWLDRRVNILNQPTPNRYDRSQLGGVEVPLLFGQNFKAVYYLMGMKIGFDVMGKDISVCDPVNESVTMVKPEIRRETELKYDLDLDTRLSAEFGFNLGPERSDKVRSRLAFYADWGMYPLHLSLVGWPTEQPHPVSTKVGDPNDYATYELTHYNSLAETTTMPGKFNQHFQVGLKFTLVLGK